MKETIAKINKTKGWFFEKINKIDKPLARLMKKKRENTQLNRIRNEKGEVTTDTAEIQRIMGDYYKQPKCPSIDEWIKKLWHIYTMEYYSAMKRNKIELFVVRWMDLESVIQSEVSQKEKNKYHMLTHIYGI